MRTPTPRPRAESVPDVFKAVREAVENLPDDRTKADTLEALAIGLQSHRTGNVRIMRESLKHAMQALDIAGVSDPVLTAKVAAVRNSV